MRYLVKVYTVTDDESAAVERAVNDGVLRDAERLDGFTQGTTDSKGVRALVEQGLSAMSVDEIAGSGVASSFNQVVRELATKALLPLGLQALTSEDDAGFEVERADGRKNYLLVRIVGALTPLRLQRLNNAEVRIVEKRDAETYVIKAASAATLKTLEFISGVRTYSADETLIQAETGSIIPAPLREFEALVHADADPGRVAEAIATMGATVTSLDARSIRFALGNAAMWRLADIPEIAQLQEFEPPRLLNDASQALVGLPIENGAATVANLDGTGQVIGVADTGIDDAHPDLAGRIVGIEALGRPGDHSDPNGHGTHVAGTIIGSGAASGGKLRGAAPGATIFFQSLLDANGRLGGLPKDVGTLFASAYARGVRIHNNSWGAFLEARYGSNSVQVDRFVHAHQDFLPIIAAGNSGRCSSAEAQGNSKVGYVDYPSIATPASAKNGLTVGASRSSRTQGGYSQMTWKAMWAVEFPEDPIGSETISGNPEAIAGFSSRGPVENDVLKPDLVAPGTDVASTRSSDAPFRNFWGAYPNNTAYAFLGGTSMAAPLVAGAAALVRQYYQNERAHEPSAALLKATLINGTTRLTHIDSVAEPDGDPNYHQGFGRLDMLSTLPTAGPSEQHLHFIDTMGDPALEFEETGSKRSWTLTHKRPGELRLCLAWTDFPSSGLQNSLLLFLNELGSKRRWVSNARVPRAINLPTRLAPGVLLSRDPRNNVQVIRVADAIAGDYVVSVIASNILFPPQGFALVATGSISGLTAL